MVAEKKKASMSMLNRNFQTSLFRESVVSFCLQGQNMKK